jgi:hypothetical protein
MIKLKFLVVFIFSLLIYSCQYTDDGDFQYDVGNDFVKDPVKLVMIDTLVVNTYTTVSDTVATSQIDRFMVGRSENKFGIVTTCESYFRFDPAEVALHASSVYESASLILNLDGYSFGDSTKICKMEVYQLTEEITVNDETGDIYNNRQFAHESTPLITFSVDLTDKKLDSLVVKLPDAFGKELFDSVYNSAEFLSDADLFKAKYKGFVIKPADDNISSVVGFIANPDSVSSPRIKIRYRDNSIDDDLSFNIEIEKYSNGTKNINYYASNYFKNDYSKLISDTIPSTEEKLSSSKTDNVTFLQGGLNLRTRIEIPTIDNLHYLGIGSVIKAELIFEPVKGTYSNRSDLPSSLEMYLCDKKNENYGQMSLVGSSDLAYGVLHYNNEFKNDTYYSFDVTKYVVDEYLSTNDPMFSLLMTLPQKDISSNVNQLIIGDQNHQQNKMKLRVYVATY